MPSLQGDGLVDHRPPPRVGRAAGRVLPRSADKRRTCRRRTSRAGAPARPVRRVAGDPGLLAERLADAIGRPHAAKLSRPEGDGPVGPERRPGGLDRGAGGRPRRRRRRAGSARPSPPPGPWPPSPTRPRALAPRLLADRRPRRRRPAERPARSPRRRPRRAEPGRAGDLRLPARPARSASSRPRSRRPPPTCWRRPGSTPPQLGDAGRRPQDRRSARGRPPARRPSSNRPTRRSG